MKTVDSHLQCVQSERQKTTSRLRLTPPGHETQIEPTSGVQKTSWTSSEHKSSVQGVCCKIYIANLNQNQHINLITIVDNNSCHF